MINISEVSTNDDYIIIVRFENGEEKIFDIKPYLEKGVFKELKNMQYFHQIQSKGYYIEWPHGQDISADTLYFEGKKLEIFSK